MSEMEKKDNNGIETANSVKCISLVVPVYNEEEGIDEFYRRVKAFTDKLKHFNWEIIFVDDGSVDNSFSLMSAIADNDRRVKVVKFSRNFGHQMAITAGNEIAKGDAVVVIDADLQDPPEVIEKFIEKWQEGFDVVYGVRKKRDGESKMKLVTASFFYRTLKKITNVDIPVDAGDFRLMDKRIVKELNRCRERDRYVRGLVSWLGYRQTAIHYDRDVRFAGETKYPYKKMIKFAIDGITSFSSFPLQLSTWMGYLASITGFLYACYVVVQKFSGNTVPGFASIVVGMFFLGGVQLICLGIVGEYIARIFNEIKSRPKYLVDKIYNDKD